MTSELKNIQLLSKGGQKEVFKAHHDRYGAVVYKKILSISDSLERTRREIVAASQISSNRVPIIYEHNCTETNPAYFWIIEQFIEGTTLRSVLASGKKFNIDDVLKFLETMLALATRMEDLRIVHRDIKPENIIIDSHGNFWLIDFGIARHLDLNSITQTNAFYGVFSFGYSSSEQFRNYKADIDSRTDLFSIGVVAYEMITGINPYLHGSQNPLEVLQKLENILLPPLNIQGDSQFQLSAFIALIGDFRRTRRPRAAKDAALIFESVKATLN